MIAYMLLKRYITAVFILLVSFLTVAAQSDPISQVFSPNAAELGKYGKIPVSYFTGLPNIRIPLSEVQGKNLTLPVHLTYHADGNKPEQHPGWVGQGWTLHAGGCINRIINGWKDELSYIEFKSNYPESAITYQPGYFDNMADMSIMNWMDTTVLKQSYNVYCPIDRMPDEFQVNLDDIQASFYFVGENDIRIVSQSNVDFKVECHMNDGELALSSGPNDYDGSLVMYRDAIDTSITFKAHLYRYIDKITITSKDGTKYHFGGDRESIEFSIRQRYSKEYAQLHPSEHKWNAVGTANTWMLTKIERPDGEEISLSYNHNGIPIVRSVSHEVFGFNEVVGANQSNMAHYVAIDTFAGTLNGQTKPYLGIGYHFLMPCYLTNISSNRTGDYLVFEKTNSTELEYEFNPLEIDYLVGTFNEPSKPFPPAYLKSHSTYKKLTNIRGRRGTFTFVYNNSSFERLRLESVDIKNNNTVLGKYSFEYNNAPQPHYNARVSDVFGYYNGQAQPASHADTVGININCLYVNPDSLQAGILTKITYPTGGHTTFEYEPHSYGKIAGQFPFSVYSSSGAVGGLRIKKITDSSGQNNGTRQFYYVDESGHNSGILSGIPRCSVSGTLKRTAGLFPTVTVEDDYSIYQDASITPLSLTSGCHITYSYVKEVLEDGSYIYYHYSNHDEAEYRDSLSANTAGSITGRMIGDSYISKELCRGLLLSKKEYSSSGVLVRKDIYSYSLEPDEFVPSVSRISLCGTHEPFIRLNYNRIYCYFPHPTYQTTQTYFDSNTAITESNNFGYDKYRNLTLFSKTVGNQTKEIRTSYSGTMGWGNYSHYLIPKGITGLPVEKKTLLNGSFIAAEITDYNTIGLFESHYAAEIDTPLATFTNYQGVPASRDSHYPSTPDMTVQSRDSYGNPKTVYTMEDGYQTLVWNSDGNKLCMKGHGNNSMYYYDFENNYTSPAGFNSDHCHVGPFVLNCTIDFGVDYYCDYWLNTGSGWHYYKRTYPGGNIVLTTQTGACIDQVRVYPALADVDSYTWDSKGNLRSIVDVRGKVFSYEYDNLGRLLRIKDTEGATIEDYDYRYVTGGNQNNRRVRQRYTTTNSGATAPHLTEIEYYDGLGRDTQNVQRCTNMSSLVTLTEYDSSGRVSNSWLPVGTGMNGFTPYSRSSIVNQGSGSTQYADTLLYATTIYDNSPLERMREMWGPGQQWRNAGKKTAYSYYANQSTGGDLTCRRYEVIPQNDTLWNLHFTGIHVSGTLSVVKTIDEDGLSSFEFRDFEDRIILTRVVNGNEYLDTYYIYDGFGRLQAVLPPELINYIEGNLGQVVSPSGGASIKMNQFAYLYKYDSRGNCIAKKLPGCGWTYMVYNKRNQMVLSQDAEQRKTNTWLFALNDDLGRICLQGTANGSLDVFSMPLINSDVIVQRSSSSSSFYGYELLNFPFNNRTVYEVNWYDDYGFRGNWGIPDGNDARIERTVGTGDGSFVPEPGAAGASSRGLLTGRLETVIGGMGAELWSVWYYDSRGRVVQYNRKRRDGGADREEYSYSFTDDLTGKIIVHNVGASDQMTEQYSYGYDTWLRPSSVQHQLEGRPQVTLHQWTYDSVGRVVNDSRNGAAGLNTAFKTTIRGGRSQIMTGLQGQTFLEELYYQTVPPTGPVNTPLWNGRISRMDWRVGEDRMTRSYVYSYDDASRLISADYQASWGDSDFSRAYTYDSNGNVTSISGKNKSSLQLSEEQFSMTFPHTGNQLTSLLGEYDRTGRMTKDITNGISLIQYNDYDMPDLVNKGTTAYYYSYTSGGRKVETGKRIIRHIINQPVIRYSPVRSYEGSVEYTFSNSSVPVLDRIMIDGGYIDASDSTYHFFVTDHLSSVRAVTDANGNIEQVNHYGPYGELLEDSLQSLPFRVLNSDFNQYKFIGKEWDSHIASYDFGARYYSPVMAKWGTQDPLAEDYYRLSPYSYCAEDPVNIIDEKGENYYYLCDNGQIVLVLANNDQYDRLYSENGQGSYIEVYNQSILTNLTNKWSEGFSYCISPSMQLLTVYDYVTKNSSVEWAIGSFYSSTGEKCLAIIRGGSTYVNRLNQINTISNESIIATLHSHPGYVQDHGASGYLSPTIIPNDYTNLTDIYNRLKKNNLPLPRHYVYEVRNNRIYQYTLTKGDIYFGQYSIKNLKRALGL